MQQRLTDKLKLHMNPEYIEVINESPNHRLNDDSHFRLTLISSRFEGLSFLERHRLVYHVLKEEMKLIHALSLHTFTKHEWDKKVEPVKSPPCQGGHG